ncbi:maleylpyruvate isomerase family mycothiol-dependent enzyme [Epidermidibacterium keratini]|uniref:Maleylpyruvate isomerase family mycothiol-dependent enzyme n=1 Tax=Epidermidibacterium keratini TaxID=1891644 RepID=A0A7L4YP86_9ACTN|nr:maleylpyruvate isomerase family mycothiol-dependent enzyme [Epidermidibacterium keratini]QHC00619.1 maleylpyruvate isomerase family mycothiol-dependent enzyme [Epidermidibacterium keratini]
MGRVLMDITERVAHTTAAQDEALAVVSSIPDAEYAAPSALPSWTVGHVVAHLIGNCEAQARQIEYAARGEAIEVYTGGQEFREAEIQRRAVLAPAQLRAELAAQHERFSAATQGIDESLAIAPVEYRSGTVADVVNGRWMESLVHAVDLGQPQYTWRSWDEPFCRVLIDYVLERLPADRTVRLRATNCDFDITTGTGALVNIEADIADIAGFLSDRGPSLSDEITLGPYPADH